jgi:hypothetical protein
VRRLLQITKIAEGGIVTYEKVTTFPDGREVREVQRTAPQWQPHAWHLERKYPDRYGRKLQANVTLDIRALATKVAAELGLEVEALMAEAKALLKEAP